MNDRSERQARTLGARARSLVIALVALVLGAGLVGGVTSPAAAATTCSGTVMYVIAHTDDDLLFVSPDLLHDLQAGRCVRAVFTTAGEAGEGQAYWSSLERGIRATYASMAGVSNSWTLSDAGVTGRSLPLYTLAGAPVSMVFLRLPDGFPDGSGSSAYNNQSILKLWNGTQTVRPVDGSATYTKTQFQATMNELVRDFQPTTIRTTDWTTSYQNPYDHSDHWATAQFAYQAHAAYTGAHTLIGYETYAIDEYAQNVTGSELVAKVNAFVLFADYDHNVCNTPGEGCPDSPHDEWLKRQYTTASVATGNEARASGVTVTASSQGSSQAATKARDGYPHGAPVDPTKEWATIGGKAGSWIEYSFASPRQLNGAVIVDRPNLTDRVTGGRLQFTHGDGSTSIVSVGALPDNGAPETVSFPGRSVSKVRFEITAVSPSTTNVGLAELELYSNMPFVNEAPIANAGPDKQGTVGAPVTLDGTGSTDPNGQALTYDWKQISGPAGTLTGANTATPTFVPAASGTMTFSLVVGDGSALSAADTVTVSVASALAVTAAPAGGTYAPGTQVTLTGNQPMTIHYTTDGSVPTSASTVYTGPLTLSQSITLRYLGIDAQGNTSLPASTVYTVDGTPPVVTASPAGGAYAAGTTIALSANEPATIRYTTDGSTPTAASPVYSTPIPLTASFTLRYLAVDAVGNTSVPASQAYTVGADTTPPVARVSPKAGTYPAGTTITLWADEPATIYYTTNGKTPTTASSRYEEPLTLTRNMTLRFFPVDTAGNVGALRSARYVLAADTTAPVVTASPVAGSYPLGTAISLTANEPATIYYTTDGSAPTTRSLHPALPRPRHRRQHLHRAVPELHRRR